MAPPLPTSLKPSGNGKYLTGDDANKAIAYCCLLLADDDVTVTNENLQAALQAANIKVDSFMTTIYAQALGSINTKQLIGMFAGAVGSAGAAVAAGNAGGDTATADTGIFSCSINIMFIKTSTQLSAVMNKNNFTFLGAKAEEAKVESSDDGSDDDMGFGLFD